MPLQNTVNISPNLMNQDEQTDLFPLNAKGSSKGKCLQNVIDVPIGVFTVRNVYSIVDVVVPFRKEHMKAFSRERKEVAAKVVEYLNLDRWKFSWFTNILKETCGIESVLKRQRKVTNPRWLKCPYRIMLGIHLGSRGGFPEKRRWPFGIETTDI